MEFRKYANANAQVHLHDGQLRVRIADTLAGAPGDVHEALAQILLSKLFRRPVSPLYSDRYRRHLNRNEMRRCLHLVRQTRGRKFLSGPKGSVYDLEELFEKLNLEHFHGLMARPTLAWGLATPALSGRKGWMQ